MIYPQIKLAKFIQRVNRFIARVVIDETEHVVHVKNTGRCKELFLPGVEVVLEKSFNPGRKTEFSLIGVYKGERLINVDSQVPNQVVYDALGLGAVREIGVVDNQRKEVTYGNSRFDLYFEASGKKGFIEVKGVTLEDSGVAMFPDAPTIRGTKHVCEMIDAVQKGYAGYIFFLVQMQGVNYFTPNLKMDPQFTIALKLAEKAGVKILAYDSVVRPGEIILGDKVKIRL